LSLFHLFISSSILFPVRPDGYHARRASAACGNCNFASILIRSGRLKVVTGPPKSLCLPHLCGLENIASVLIVRQEPYDSRGWWGPTSKWGAEIEL
jgi:hypothetical protein